MHILKKDTTFCWDERAQEYFDAFKQALASASVISPPDYSCDFLLYVAASMEMIGMVLVQEDEELQEHVIYYLSRNLIDAEIHYSHVEKLKFSYCTCGSKFETLYSPSPDLGYSSCQSISIHSHSKNDLGKI